MSQSAPVRIDGMREFQMSLADLSGDMRDVVRNTVDEAAEMVATEARRRMPSRSGKARRSVKVVPDSTGARVQLGGPSAPYAPWLDFGGSVGRRNARGMKSVRREFKPQGRYVFPAYMDLEPKLRDLFEAAIDDLARSSGFEF